MRMRIVVALGGNMISDASNKEETFEQQLERAKNTAQVISNIISAGHQVVVTHGNGPQVGSLLLQQAANTPGVRQFSSRQPPTFLDRRASQWERLRD